MDDFIRNNARLQGNKRLTLTFDLKDSGKESKTRDESYLNLLLSRLDQIDSMNKNLDRKLSHALDTLDQIVMDQEINTGYLEAKIRGLTQNLDVLKSTINEIKPTNKYENVIRKRRREKRLEYLDLAFNV